MTLLGIESLIKRARFLPTPDRPARSLRGHPPLVSILAQSSARSD